METMRIAQFDAIPVSGIFAKAAMGLAAIVIALGVFATAADAVPRRVKRECRNDYKTLCPRYRAGTSRMRSCMRSNGSQLSWGCYQALKDYGYVKRGRRKSRRGRRRRRR
jgi:hypothetical protein